MAKRLLTFSSFCLLVIFHFQCQSQVNGFINGESDVIKENISVSSFKGVNLGISGDVVLTQGSPQHVSVEGQKNIIDNIKREVKDGMWNIYFLKNVRDAKKVTVYITVPSLDEISLTGSGAIRSANKFTGIDNIDINIAGSGSITLDYNADISDVELTGSGSVNLSGQSNTLAIAISGSGNVDAKNLIANECEVKITGSGDATVNASKNLETHITGSGDIQYTGAANVESSITGSGRVRKVSQ